MKPISVNLPIDNIDSLRVGDCILVSGTVLAGRDAALPKVGKLFREGKLEDLDVRFQGNAVFHTAVSFAGIGPTSSNKLEIEESFPALCEAGVKVFLGKGALSADTVRILEKAKAIFAVVPPVTALLKKGTLSQRLVAFPELGMEALYELKMKDCPAIIAIAHGESSF